MAKRKLYQTRLSATSFAPSAAVPTAAVTAASPTPTSAAAAAAATVTANDTTTVTHTATSSAAAAKIPFRSRKIRNVSSDVVAPKKNPTALPRPLTAAGELPAALLHLRSADPLLARVISTHRPPSFASPRPPFHALSRSILYQQLALKAAATIYARFLSLCGGDASVLPATVLALSPLQLRQIGVSGRKASYLHDLAANFQSGVLSDATVVNMDDDTLFSMLTAVRGIGAWSVHMFMIFTLHRPDVLPIGDLSIRKGVQVLYGLKEVPTPAKVEELCEHWKPYRSVGSWYMYRLIEDKGTPAVPPTITTEIPVDGAANLEQPQLIDPVTGTA